ncbi:aminoglycoside phosphotransferase family protein [Corynebacterium occultum]|uniref:aminoglycoside phosphotransferase family protein n=1 Tax=Corynebacterium occultum TaxID=2675219 RepID=UPI0018CE7E15
MNKIIVRLGLQPQGEIFSTKSSLPCHVLFNGQPAFLKVTNEIEELTGAHALEKGEGKGAEMRWCWNVSAARYAHQRRRMPQQRGWYAL